MDTSEYVHTQPSKKFYFSIIGLMNIIIFCKSLENNEKTFYNQKKIGIEILTFRIYSTFILYIYLFYALIYVIFQFQSEKPDDDKEEFTTNYDRDPGNIHFKNEMLKKTLPGMTSTDKIINFKRLQHFKTSYCYLYMMKNIFSNLMLKSYFNGFRTYVFISS